MLDITKTKFIRSAASEKDFPDGSFPRLVFVGRSNVGKSSTINALLAKPGFARTSSVPGKTVFVNLFMIDEQAWLVDLPGYGYAKTSKAEQQRYSALIESYLSRDRQNISRMYMVVDARHKPTQLDRVMADWIRSFSIPYTVIANKLDKLKKSEIEPNLARIRSELCLPDDVKLIAFSAQKLTGRDELLRDVLDASLSARRCSE